MKKKLLKSLKQEEEYDPEEENSSPLGVIKKSEEKIKVEKIEEGLEKLEETSIKKVEDLELEVSKEIEEIYNRLEVITDEIDKSFNLKGQQYDSLSQSVSKLKEEINKSIFDVAKGTEQNFEAIPKAIEEKVKEVREYIADELKKFKDLKIKEEFTNVYKLLKELEKYTKEIGNSTGGSGYPDVAVNTGKSTYNSAFWNFKNGSGTIARVSQNPQTGQLDISFDSTAISENYKTAISATDTTPNYLLNKLIAGANVNLTQENIGGNEDIKIDVLPAGSLPDVQYNNSGVFGAIPSNSTATEKFLSQTSSGVPSWQTIPAAGLLTYYLTNTASSISTYLQQVTTPYTPKTTQTYTPTTSSVLKNFSTNAGFPNLMFIPAGQFEFHIHASKTSGTKTASLYAEFWEVSSVGVDIGLIGTSEATGSLTGSEAEYRVYFTTANVYNLTSTSSRIVCRVFVTISGAGTNPTVNLYVGGEADSHIALPSNTIDATNFVPYNGDIYPLVMTHSITSTQFIKSGGLSTEFLKADGSSDSTSYTPTSRTLTINGTTYDLTADRSWSVGTVTGATDSTLTLTGSTLGLNLGNANTWTGTTNYQNWLYYSQDLSQSSKYTITRITAVANATTAPDGTTTATSLTPTGADAFIYQSYIIPSAGQRTFSVYLKSATGSNVSTSLNIYNGTSRLAFTNITVTTSWQRFSVSYNFAVTDGNVNFYIGAFSTLTTGQNLYAWGTQLNDGSSAGTYFPTTTIRNGASTNSAFFNGGISAFDKSSFNGIYDNGGITTLGNLSIGGVTTGKGFTSAGVDFHITGVANFVSDGGGFFGQFFSASAGNNLQLKTYNSPYVYITGDTVGTYPALKFGIGTATPATTLHVMAASAASTRESVARFGVSDASTDFIQIGNATISDGTFAGAFQGIVNSSSGQSPVSFTAYTTSANDTGVSSMLKFRANVTDNTTSPANGTQSDVGTRPIADFGTNNTIMMRLIANGNFGIGVGTSDPSARLHIIKTTEQLRLGYDSSNYFKTTVASDGSATFALTGTTPKFTFSQDTIFSGDVKATTYHVGTDAGIDATVTYVDTLLGAKTLTFKKGILTAQV